MRRSILLINKGRVWKLVCVFLSIITLIFGAAVVYWLLYTGKIYPNISIAGINIGGLSVENATTLVSSNVDAAKTIQLTSGGQTFDISLKDIDFS